MQIFNKTMNELYLEDTKDNYIYVGDITEASYSITNTTSHVFDSKMEKITATAKLASWIFSGRNVEIKFTDNASTPTYQYQYRRIKAVYNNTTTSEYWFTLDKPLVTPSGYSWHSILGVPKVNREGKLLLDSMNNRISSVSDVNSQNLVICDSITLDSNKGLLIHDKEEYSLSGSYSINTSTNNKLLAGSENARAKQELSAGDLIRINDTTNIVKKVTDNRNVELEYAYSNNISGQTIYRISREESDIESIIYDTYNFENGIGSENYKNLFSIRPNRVIYYKFNAEQKSGDMTTTTRIDLESSWTSNDKIYKLWINGVLVNSYEYTVDNTNKRITLLTTDNIKPTYNYYVYITYKESTRNGSGGQNAVFRYSAYDTNFVSKKEYLSHLYKFAFFDNFNENLSNTYAEINNDFLDIKRRVLKTRNNSISFTSAVGRSTRESESLVISDDIKELIDNLYNFRIIRFVQEADKFIVYTNCQLINPANETVGEDKDSLSYSINFKNKLVFKNRLFGEGDWGRFNPFGLKLISST